MAKGRGGNTGPGNYRAPVLGQSAAQLKKILSGVPTTKHPNRNLSTTEYKRTLKKEAESNE